jgi:hypothetical protein
VTPQHTIVDPDGTPYGGREDNFYLDVAIGSNLYEDESYDSRAEQWYGVLLEDSSNHRNNNRGGTA